MNNKPNLQHLIFNIKDSDSVMLYEMSEAVNASDLKKSFSHSPWTGEQWKKVIDDEIPLRIASGDWEIAKKKVLLKKDKKKVMKTLFNEKSIPFNEKENIIMTSPVDLDAMITEGFTDSFIEKTKNFKSNVIFCSSIFKKTLISHTGAVKKNGELIWYIREKTGETNDNKVPYCFIGDEQVCISDLMDFIRQDYQEQFEWLIANKYYLFVALKNGHDRSMDS